MSTCLEVSGHKGGHALYKTLTSRGSNACGYTPTTAILVQHKLEIMKHIDPQPDVDIHNLVLHCLQA